jgi:GT2 family glycosyltransferase
MTESDTPDSIAWPLVLAVVVTHNGRRWMPGCLKSLALQTYPALEVVVVDAASADPESVQRLVGRLLPTASILRLDRNIGFGAAANRALELSPDARSAEYYLFLHDDVALDRDCVGLLVAAALETDAGVVGGKGLSWDEPEVLLEVGMSADEFGYPVSGLEEGEIDQSQHDTRREVLFVTSACILVSRATVERCGSWDGEYFLFGEDHDLCMRARLCGFPVVVTPAARFYHAVAMATGRREDPPPDSVRYFTRRNRLRTIAKNASTTRVLILLALYTGLVSAEVVLLAALRRFEEIPPYARAYGWFFRSLPDVARRRRAIQGRRKVSDRRVRRYMVRELPRARIFLERRLVQWGAETMAFSQKTLSHLTPSVLVARASRWVRSPGVTVSGLIALVLVIAARHTLLGSPVGAGTLWPFPGAPHQLLTQYFAAWREVGLGTSGAPPPSLPLMWLVSVVSFGNPAVAQKVLVAALLGTGLVGVYRFMRRRTAFLPAQIVAVGVYALAPVLRLAVVTGDLGALALFALAPYLLETGLRMAGPVPGSAPGPTPGSHALRPAVPLTMDAMSRQAVRLGLLSALTIALAPSATVALAVFWVLAGLFAAAQSPRPAEGVSHPRATTRRLGWILVSLGAAMVVLIPWSLEALRGSGPIFGPLFDGRGGGASLNPLWASLDLAHGVLLVPGVSLFAGVVTVGALGGAMLIASTSRRREIRLLAVVIVGFGLWGGLVAKGWLPAPVATPALWLALPLMGLAVCAGYLVAAVAEDVPRHVAGWRQFVGAAAVVVFLVGAFGGWVPTLLSWSAPPPSLAAGTGSAGQTNVLASVQGAAVGGTDFRVLWLGSTFVAPMQEGIRPEGAVPYLVTGADGITMLDASPPPDGAAGTWLTGVVNTLIDGGTHLAGHLLATAGIRFVIVQHDDPATSAAVLRQQDLALTQEIAGVDIYQNIEDLPIAGPAPNALAPVAGSATPLPVVLAQWNAGTAYRRVSSGAFSGPAAPGSPLLLAEAYSAGWRASIGGRVLAHGTAFGWANRFAVPAGATGTVQIDFRGEWKRLVWVLLEAAALALAIAMAVAARAPRTGEEGPVGGPPPAPTRPPPGPLAGAVRPAALPAGTRRRVASRDRARRDQRGNPPPVSGGPGGAPDRSGSGRGGASGPPSTSLPWRRTPPAPRRPWPGLPGKPPDPPPPTPGRGSPPGPGPGSGPHPGSPSGPHPGSPSGPRPGSPSGPPPGTPPRPPGWPRRER